MKKVLTLIFFPLIWLCKDIKSEFDKDYEDYKVETDQVWVDRL